MTRLLELIVAIVIVAILALIVGVCLPSTGHIERSATVSKDIRHVYDVFANFRRFPDYSMLNAYKEGVEYQQSENKWYGPGASISWTGNGKKGKSPVGHGKLTIASAKPGFDKVEVAGKASIVWDIDNDWHGSDKHFTIDLDRTGRQQKLVKITWSYDVDYGWNLINRYAGLYIHGRPDTFIKRSLHNLSNLLAAIPNIRYNDLDPKVVDTPPQPVLVVSTQAKRNLTQMGAAADKAEAKIKAAMKELGLKAAGPRIRFTTNYGDTKVLFDVAIPIQSDTVTIDDKEYTLTKPHAKSGLPTDMAEAASVAAASSAPAEAGSAPAEAGSVAKADDKSADDDKSDESKDIGPQPGDLDDQGRLIITKDVRAMLAFGGKALQGVWYGSPAGVPVTRLRLKAYAETHGYPFDAVAHRLYDKQIRGYGDMGPNGKPLMFDQQFFKIFLPVSAAPEQTPEQAAGMEPRNPFAEPANAASAPANAGSAPANAASAPANAGSAPAEAGSTEGEASDGLGPKRPAAAPIGA